MKNTKIVKMNAIIDLKIRIKMLKKCFPVLIDCVGRCVELHTNDTSV